MNKLLISKTALLQLSSQFSPQFFLSHFPSFHRKNQNFLNSPPRKCSYTPKFQTFCIGAPSNSFSYGGWDDPQFNDDSFISGESTQLQNFLNSLGINDKRYIFVYLLGFICALGVTRIRVSSIIAIPACVIVFAVGFTFGYVNGAHFSLNGIKKGPKDEIFRGSIDKLRSLVDMLNWIDAKIVDLKDGIKKNIENNQVTLTDLEGVVKSAESINVSVLNAKGIVEGLLGIIMIEKEDLEKNVNQQASKRRKEVEKGIDLSRHIVKLIKEKLAGSTPNKTKDLNKRDAKDFMAKDPKHTNILAPAVEVKHVNRYENDREGKLLSNTPTIIEDTSTAEMDGVSGRVFGSKDYGYRNKRSVYINNHEVSMKMDHPNGVEKWDSRDGLLDSTDFSFHIEHTKTEASISQEQKIQDLKGSYLRFNDVEEQKFQDLEGSYLLFNNVEEGEAETEDDPSLGDEESTNDNGYESSPSLIVSDDKEFNRYLTEANILLKEAKRVLLRQGNDGDVDNVLSKSANLLSKAIEIRPMSLLAVGQLGNTYLLHGELKLRISRKLRVILAGKDSVSVDEWELAEQDDKFSRKDKLRYALIDVCEECEKLLIKAGRNYRLALSIDGNDMRALYNWGLALSFRGQLIADIGPGAARDADKVFLAAIDKFDAMLTKSNTYAPDALFRWGAALQQRSRLRRRNSKEKLKLLQQARRLYEDALDMQSNNLQVQEALSSCISELNFWYN